tara:strand:+ start:19331 stop:20431 length:1101 start_codon:yes stop_codon:yes gene_type:complete
VSEIESFDAIILGAGLSGLSAADSLMELGYQCAIVDTGFPGSGASGAPMMLANPATGRRARRMWRAEDCFESLLKYLIKIEKKTGRRCYSLNGVVRPALTAEIADDFNRSPDKYEWLAGWIEWIDAEKFSEQFPYFNTKFGGLYIPKGITLKGAEYCESMVQYLESENCYTLFGSKPEIIKNGNQWIIQIEGDIQLITRIVIDATGYQQTINKHWSFIPLHPIKGQTATLHFDEQIPLKHSVSSLGYIAVMPDHPNEITVGSTYEHLFQDQKPDPKGLSYLRGKLEKTLPGYWAKSKSVEQWASVRVSVQDKMPVIGEHPECKGLYFIGAMGSKGLMMSRYVADILAQNICNGIPLEPSLSLERFI